MPRQPQSKNWVFTSYQEDAPIFIETLMMFLAYEQETCPETGRKHWQGYVSMLRKTTLSAIKTNVNESWHWEIMRGSFSDNQAYCNKEGGLVKFGTCPIDQQGVRNDVNAVRARLINGENLDDIILTEPYLYQRAGRVMERLNEIILRSRRRNWETRIIWFYGPTGTGKTREVYEREEKSSLYIKPLGRADVNWWDAYRGEEAILLDDFRGQLDYDELLRLADRYPMTVSRRGREPLPFLAKRIYITSALRPDEVYLSQNARGDSLRQLERRVVELKQFVDPVNAAVAMP